jgi:hypothetical protein
VAVGVGLAGAQPAMITHRRERKTRLKIGRRILI